MYCQVDYKLNDYFYTLTAYDIDYCDGDESEIVDQICAENHCSPLDIEVMWDTLATYDA